MKEFLKLENKMILKLRIKPLSPLLIKLGTDTESSGKTSNRGCFITTKSSSDVQIKIKDGEIELDGDGRLGEFYIPGSTLKGLFRDRFITMFDNKELENSLFGVIGAGDGSNNARRSRFFAEDAYLYSNNIREEFCIENGKEGFEKLKKRILNTRAITPLDHFSAAVVSPLKNEYLTEDFQVDIIVSNITRKELQGIYFILRDSINGELRIGNSKARGFGIIEFNVDDLKIEIFKKENFLLELKEFFVRDEDESIKIGDKYLKESLHLHKDYKEVNINKPNDFILALFGEVK